MVMPLTAYEYEGLFEDEDEWEDEADSEAFFEMLGVAARTGRTPPVIRKASARAARAAMSGMRALDHLPHGLREDEYESEWEVNPYDRIPRPRIQPSAMMEHLGHMAAEAESEAEAEAFIGALIPLAARLLPRVAPTIMRAAPGLIRGVAGVTRTLRQNPSTRPLVRAVPSIVRQTAASLDRQARAGRPVTPQTAVRTLARQTQRTIGSPRQSVRAWNRSCAVDARYHRAVGGVPRRAAPVRIGR